MKSNKPMKLDLLHFFHLYQRKKSVINNHNRFRTVNVLIPLFINNSISSLPLEPIYTWIHDKLIYNCLTIYIFQVFKFKATNKFEKIYKQIEKMRRWTLLRTLQYVTINKIIFKRIKRKRKLLFTPFLSCCELIWNLLH